MMWRLVCLVGACLAAAAAGPAAGEPKEIVLARATFVDYGPPFGYFELFFLKPAKGRVEIERLILAGPRDECRFPPRRAVTRRSVAGGLSSLFGGVAPCSASDASLTRSAACKDCVFFEGANVAMRFACGGATRTLRLPPAAFRRGKGGGAAVQLMGELNRAFSGSRENPMAEELGRLLDGGSGELFSREAEVLSGDFDNLFAPETAKVSLLYQRWREGGTAEGSKTQLIASTPHRPVEVILPDYPPLGYQARVEAVVAGRLRVDQQGKATEIAMEPSHPWMVDAATAALAQWRFPATAAGSSVQVKFRFTVTCLEPALVSPRAVP